MEYLRKNAIQDEEYSRQHTTFIAYGTAGFRKRADLLNHVMFRMGILAVLRSKFKKATTGLMITASHNPGIDNGVKLVDPAGEMLESPWENVATNIANAKDDELLEKIEAAIMHFNIKMRRTGRVIIGRDTRQSSPALACAATAGIEAMSGVVTDLGEVTTPQLHYIVMCTNFPKKGDATIEAYYDKLCNPFKIIRQCNKDKANYKGELHLDVANGIGGAAARQLKQRLENELDIIIFNDGEKDGALNYNCGADFTKVHQKWPVNSPRGVNVRCASLDGDADRIVYYYTNENDQFRLLDGDRIASLAASYLKELIAKSKLKLNLAVIQTAYANGGSTHYISNTLEIPVFCVPTGVKHLHKKASEYDIGVYFEANGHGTVLFKDSAVESIREASQSQRIPEEDRLAASKLYDLYCMINQAVGDALSDMLMVETILHAKGWGPADWDKTYVDLPWRQIKVSVSDTKLFKTDDADRKCVEPAGLQDEIDKIVEGYSRARAFVRPSGTEDCVRVYAECENPMEIDGIVLQIVKLVYDYAGES